MKFNTVIMEQAAGRPLKRGEGSEGHVMHLWVLVPEGKIPTCR